MTKKAMVAAGLLLFLSAPAFSDTPIGKGVTGSGGTGPNEADVQAKAREAKTGRAEGLNPDGSEPGAMTGAQSRDQGGARGATGSTPSRSPTEAPATAPGGTVTGGGNSR